MTIIMILTCLLLCACFCRLWWLCYAEYYDHVMHIIIIMLRLLLWPCDALYYDHMMPMIMVMLCFLIWPCYAYYYDHGMRIIITMVCILLCVDGLMRVHVSNHRLLLCWLHQVKRVHTTRSINKHWLQNNHTRTRELVFQTNNQGRVGRTIANACLHLGQMAWKTHWFPHPHLDPPDRQSPNQKYDCQSVNPSRILLRHWKDGYVGEMNLSAGGWDDSGYILVQGPKQACCFLMDLMGLSWGPYKIVFYGRLIWARIGNQFSFCFQNRIVRTRIFQYWIKAMS